MYAVVYLDGTVVVGNCPSELCKGWTYEVRPEYFIITKTPAQCRDWQSRRLPLSAYFTPKQQLLRELYRTGTIRLLKEFQDVHEIA